MENVQTTRKSTFPYSCLDVLADFAGVQCRHRAPHMRLTKYRSYYCCEGCLDGQVGRFFFFWCRRIGMFSLLSSKKVATLICGELSRVWSIAGIVAVQTGRGPVTLLDGA